MASYIASSVTGPRRQQDECVSVISQIPLMMKLANVNDKLDYLKFVQEQFRRPEFPSRQNMEPFSKAPGHARWRDTQVSNDNQLIAALAVFTHYTAFLHRQWWETGDLVAEVNRLAHTLPRDKTCPFDVATIHYNPGRRAQLLSYISLPNMALEGELD